MNFLESVPKILVSVCKGEWCLFTETLMLFLTGACSGCLRSNVASLVIALWHIFSIQSSIGGIAACASNESVGELLNPPVIANVPACCTITSFFMALIEPFLLPFAFLLCIGVHQMSMPYSILGSATLT